MRGERCGVAWTGRLGLMSRPPFEAVRFEVYIQSFGGDAAYRTRCGPSILAYEWYSTTFRAFSRDHKVIELA